MADTAFASRVEDYLIAHGIGDRPDTDAHHRIDVNAICDAIAELLL